MVRFIKRDNNDIFKMPILRFLFKNQKFLLVLRISVAALFFYAIYMGYADSSKNNIFTTAVFWGIFWPLFIVTTLPTFGRIFCGICPHGFLGKYITKAGLKKKMPKWLENRFIGIMLLFLGWWGVYYMFPGVYRTPLGSAILFSVMTVLAFFIYFLYKDMSYCKYICPIGTALRAFGKLSFTWFGSYESACKSCKTFDCAKTCPYGLSPFNFDKKNSISDCTLCMECTHSCEAINFRFVKPGFSLYNRFKTLKAEVWVYILILAAIPISMAFHHGLGRSNISDHFIWAKTAEFFKQFVDFGKLDATGMFAFLYAALFTIAAAVIGMWIASKIVKKDFGSVFYTLGYAFAPLFIFASMGHALEFFFTGNYERIVEGLAWGFGFDVDVEPLAKRGDRWLQIFHLFRWIAVFWALFILYKRMAFIETDKVRKVIAYPFAALLIIFFVGVNLYRDYVIETYGRKPRGHHTGSAAMMMKKNSKNIEKVAVLPEQSVWFKDRLPGSRRMGMMGRRVPNAVPKRRVWLVTGELGKPKCVINPKGTFYTVDTEGVVKEVEPKKRGCISVSFEMPKSGYYSVYYLQDIKTPRKEYIKVAKYEFKRFDHSSHAVYDKKKMAAKTIKEVPFDILRLRPENETFYSRLHTGEEVKFMVLKDGRPLEGAKVVLVTQFGWQKSQKSDENGIAKFKLIKDYYPDWEKYNKRFREKFIVVASFEEEGKEYETTYIGTYSPSRNEYQSYAYGLLTAIIILIAASAGIFVYRYRTQKPFKEVKIDEQD
ncbi:4Fe-4S binding protein [Nitrosophilus alvini]|uniref:4Fe-4S binding protein n=1 Tax=Nitrosophilus alvini TaxID=2714855 RepID=UPI00190A6048|nr:4Fe-4S binding protein [Nitrosophilus alvini]